VNKTLKLASLALLICAQCLGQSKYNNQLQPGLNTRDDAARVLGQPIRALGATQIKLRASKGKEDGGAVVSTVALTMLFGPIGLLKGSRHTDLLLVWIEC